MSCNYLTWPMSSGFISHPTSQLTCRPRPGQLIQPSLVYLTVHRATLDLYLSHHPYTLFRHTWTSRLGAFDLIPSILLCNPVSDPSSVRSPTCHLCDDKPGRGTRILSVLV